MADRRRGKQRRREDNVEKPTKEEYGVAKFLRFNLPVKEGKLVGITVQYFIASKAIDLLLESKWGPTKSKEDALFQTRSGCVDYLDQLLRKGIFHRAAKIEKKKDKDKDRDKRRRKPLKEEPEESGKEEKSKKEKKTKKLKEKEEEKLEKGGEKDSPEADKEKESEGEKEEKKDDEKKRKRKLKLEMHDYQVFKDGPEVYVWIYDPVPVKTFIIGLLLVLGAIAVCLFPLWPPEVRLGVYYISLAAALFVGVILSLCVIRLVLFCLVWVCTFGHHHFWFLPNLTEDVGFLDSFRPLYKHDHFDGKEDDEKTKKKSKNDSDSTKAESGSQKDEKSEKEKDDGAKKKDESGSENENSYEIVHKEEVDDDDVPPLEGEEEEDEDEAPPLEGEEDDDEEEEDAGLEDGEEEEDEEENISENDDTTETKKTK